jgi:hypothetical protein
MIERTVEELTPILGTRSACRGLGASPATIYRHRRPPQPTRGHHYQGSGHLPGPDSHRQAALALGVRQRPGRRPGVAWAPLNLSLLTSCRPSFLHGAGAVSAHHVQVERAPLLRAFELADIP